MVADIHTCSYACDNPPCIKAQRDELASRLETLTAELEALRRDAERYRWLRDDPPTTLCVRQGGCFIYTDGQVLDAAIDAARHQEAASGR